MGSEATRTERTGQGTQVWQEKMAGPLTCQEWLPPGQDARLKTQLERFSLEMPGFRKRSVKSHFLEISKKR